MSSVLYAVVIFFRFLLERILDIISIALLLCSVAAVWRVPMLVTELRCRDMWEFRLFCAYAFVTALGDIVTLPILCIVLCSWRSISFCTEVPHTHKDSNACWVEVRLLVWHQFLRLFLDIPFIIMGLFVHVTVWRIFWFWDDITTEAGRVGTPLFGCTSVVSYSSDLWDPFRSKFRGLIAYHALNSLFELLCLPMMIPLLLTGYRMPGLIEYWRTPTNTASDKKLEFVKQFLNLLLDFPFWILGFFTCLFCIRAKYMIEDVCALTTAPERRRCVALHCVLSLRDLLVLFPFAVVLVSIYRGYLAIKLIVAKSSRWADPNPKLQVISAAFEAPVGRPTGIVLRMQCSKEADFELTADTPIKAFIRNPELWGAVKKSHGATAAAVGETMMPLALAPRYFKPATVCKGSTDVELVFDFDVSQKTGSLLREGAKVGCKSLLQIEYGSHDGTLVVVGIEMAKTMDASKCDQDQILNADLVGKRIFDVMWEVVLIQFLFLLLDIIALVFFVLMHLIPPRVYRVYSQGCEGPARKTARRVMQMLELSVDVMKRAPSIAHATVESIDASIRKSQDANNSSYYAGAVTSVAAYARDETPFDTEFAAPLNKLIADLASSSQPAASAACREAAVGVREHLVRLIAFTCSIHPEVNIASPAGIVSNEAGAAAAEPDQDGGRLLRMESFVPQHSSQLSTDFGAPEREPVTPSPGDGPVVATTPAQMHAAVEAATVVHLDVLKTVLFEAKETYRRLPWCGGREGWPGFRSVVFREVAQTILDAVGILTFIIVLCSVYRTYSLLWSISNRRANEDLRIICIRNFVEIFVDLLYLLKFIAVLVGIRGIFSMPSDLVTFLCIKPTFAVARQVIDHHLYLLLADLVYLLSLCLAWDAIRLTVATVVFGAFAPGVLLETAFAEWETPYTGESSDAWGRTTHMGRARMASKNHCRAFYILLFSTFWVFGLPCLCTYYVGQNNAPAVPIVYFSILAFMCILGIFAAFGHGDSRVLELRRSIVRAIKPTWQNALPFLGMLLEGMFFVASMFAVTTEATWTQYGAGERVRDVSRYVFMDFGQDWAVNGLPFGVYFSVVVMLVHFVIAAMPIVCDQMLHWRDSENLVFSTAWITSLQVLGQYCLLLVSRNVAIMVTCNGLTDATLVANRVVTCYADRHLHLATLMLILFTYYLPSSVMRSSTFDESLCATLDVAYTQLYRLLVNLGGAVAVIMPVLLYQTPVAGVALVLVACLWNLWWTVAYGPFVNREEKTFVTVDSAKRYRVAMYAALTVCSVLVLIAAATESNVMWAVYATGGIILIAWFATALRNIAAERDWPREGIEEVSMKLREAEADLAQRGALNTRWARQRARWCSRVNSAARASTLAVLALELEQHAYVAMLPPGFFSNRAKWVLDTKALVSSCDQDMQLDVNYELDSRSWEHMIICCDCGCCSHYDRSSGWTLEPPEKAKLENLLMSVTTLRNAVRSSGAMESAFVPTLNFESATVRPPQSDGATPNAAGHATFVTAASSTPPPQDAGHARFVPYEAVDL